MDFFNLLCSHEHRHKLGKMITEQVPELIECSLGKKTAVYFIEFNNPNGTGYRADGFSNRIPQTILPQPRNHCPGGRSAAFRFRFGFRFRQR